MVSHIKIIKWLFIRETHTMSKQSNQTDASYEAIAKAIRSNDNQAFAVAVSQAASNNFNFNAENAAGFKLIDIAQTQKLLNPYMIEELTAHGSKSNRFSKDKEEVVKQYKGLERTDTEKVILNSAIERGEIKKNETLLFNTLYQALSNNSKDNAKEKFNTEFKNANPAYVLGCLGNQERGSALLSLALKMDDTSVATTLLRAGATPSKAQAAKITKNTLLRDAFEEGSLKQLENAFIKGDKTSAEAFINVIKENKFDINRPIPGKNAASELATPVVFAVVSGTNSAGSSPEKYKSDKKEIFEIITRLPGFNINTLGCPYDALGKLQQNPPEKLHEKHPHISDFIDATLKQTTLLRGPGSLTNQELNNLVKPKGADKTKGVKYLELQQNNQKAKEVIKDTVSTSLEQTFDTYKFSADARSAITETITSSLLKNYERSRKTYGIITKDQNTISVLEEVVKNIGTNLTNIGNSKDDKTVFFKSGESQNIHRTANFKQNLKEAVNSSFNSAYPQAHRGETGTLSEVSRSSSSVRLEPRRRSLSSSESFSSLATDSEITRNEALPQDLADAIIKFDPKLKDKITVTKDSKTEQLTISCSEFPTPASFKLLKKIIESEDLETAQTIIPRIQALGKEHQVLNSLRSNFKDSTFSKNFPNTVVGIAYNSKTKSMDFLVKTKGDPKDPEVQRTNEMVSMHLALNKSITNGDITPEEAEKLAKQLQDHDTVRSNYKQANGDKLAYTTIGIMFDEKAKNIKFVVQTTGTGENEAYEKNQNSIHKAGLDKLYKTTITDHQVNELRARDFEAKNPNLSSWIKEQLGRFTQNELYDSLTQSPYYQENNDLLEKSNEYMKHILTEQQKAQETAKTKANGQSRG